jgi:DNA-binding transcriptional ArsR family regulator
MWQVAFEGQGLPRRRPHPLQGEGRPRKIGAIGESAMSGLDRELVFGALGDSCRRALLDRLRRRNGQTLSALSVGQGISRQAVTKHLKVLEDAGLVVTRRRGREKLHYLNPVPISAVAMRWLEEFDGVRLDTLAADLD